MNTKRCILCKGEIADYYSACPLCGEDPHELPKEKPFFQSLREASPWRRWCLLLYLWLLFLYELGVFGKFEDGGAWSFEFSLSSFFR